MELQPNLINRVAIGDIVRRTAVLNPNKIALIDGERRLTYRELDEACNRFAHHLLSRGLQSGDAVACLCVNSIDHIIAAYGIAKAGMIWAPMNTLLQREPLDYILEMVEAKLLVLDENFVGAMQRPGRPAPPMLTIQPGAVSPSTAEGTFAGALQGQPSTDPEVEINDRQAAIIMFTSGTTARQKGVVINHLAVMLSGMNKIIDMEMRTDDVTVAMLPFFHCAQHSIVTSFLLRGATQVIMRGFDAETLMDNIQRHKVSWIFALPAMWRAVLDHPDRVKYDLKSLRYGLYAMTPMDEQTLRRLHEELCPRFALGSGQTEVYPSACVFKPELQFEKKGNYWGTPCMTVEFQIMDDAGNLLPRGQVGELVVRGPNVMTEYLKDPEATATSRAHGWHHTGDLGLIDEDGLFLFHDRKKDMIKSGGENVASCVVEAALLGHPGVDAAAVVGLPHARWIEAVTAFVVPKAGAKPSEEEVIGWCKVRLGHHEVPKRVVFTAELPMTATGKVLKHVIRAEHQGLYTEA